MQIFFSNNFKESSTIARSISDDFIFSQVDLSYISKSKLEKEELLIIFQIYCIDEY